MISLDKSHSVIVKYITNERNGIPTVTALTFRTRPSLPHKHRPYKENHPMKSLRSILPILLLSLSAVASAQSAAQKSAQTSFDQLKTLAGTWDGPLTLPADPSMPAMPPMNAHVVLRVTSTGNAVHHEMTMTGRPDDPITMFYLDGDRLRATHYCDAGNRPSFAARISPDGKTYDFDFLDISGPLDHGHMQHIAFTFVDADHHSEAWSFMTPDGKIMAGHLDLTRSK